MTLRIGSLIPFQLVDGALDQLKSCLSDMADAGLDHAVIGDHVSFFGGFGIDGLISAGSMLALEPRLSVCTSVYQLPLRHPVIVARQLSTIANLAPGRLVFGVGLGGDDRHEVEVCGVDPKTRGQRMDECLAVVRGLQDGAAFDFEGRFFQLDEAMVLPPPPAPITIMIGGRADATFRRVARFGDGWLGLWVSPERFSEGVARIAEYVADYPREPDWQHGMTVWCGFAGDEKTAKASVSRAMERLYGQPFERFEKYSPYGSPARIADFLVPYRDAGCTTFNLLARAPSVGEGIEGVAEVARLLKSS